MYIFDKKYKFLFFRKLEDIVQIIMVKSNPSIISLIFKGSAPLLLQTHRRPEIALYIKNKRHEDLKETTRLTWSDTINITKPDGSKHTFNFDQSKKTDNSSSVKNLQLNNFCNSEKQGFLNEIHIGGLLKRLKQKQVFCVLSNVGLIYFEDQLRAPTDLFPVIDCRVEEVEARHIADTPYVFQLKYEHKEVKFKCKSKDERQEWIEAIRELQKQTEKRRQEEAQREQLKIV
jgi:hypothetical protein